MKTINSWTWLLISTITPTILSIPTTTALVDCNRAALLEAADAYITSQTAGKLDTLQSHFAPNWTYQENNKVIDVSKGVLRKPLKIDHRRTNTDLVACASYTEIIITDSANPYVIGTQIRHDADLKVTSIDTIASTTNSWLFDAKKTLQHVLQEKWDVIPEGKRDSRATIQAAGDAYMSMWDNATASEAVPCKSSPFQDILHWLFRNVFGGINELVQGRL